MKPIPVNTTVEIDVKDLTVAITPEEIGELFCHVCGGMAMKSYTLSQRRAVIGQIADGMHENALTLLGEVLALAYHRVKGTPPPP
jgi:hypothetical protein